MQNFDFDQFVSSPLTQVGMSLMTNANPGQALQQGVQQGMAHKQHFDKQRAQKAMADALRQGAKPEEVYATFLETGGDPATGAAIIKGLSGGGSDGGATDFVIRKLRAENPNLSYAQGLSLLKGLAGKGMGIDDNGNFIDAPGVAGSLGNLKEGETAGGERAKLAYTTPIEQAKAAVELEMKPKITEATAIASATGEAQGNANKRAIQAPRTAMLLDEAETYLQTATSGGLETVGREIAAFGGKATKGSEADAQLSVISAGLIENVPRMEGPQSDRDVDMYKQAAGDLANPMKPRETRQAALRTLRTLNNKYAHLNPGKASTATGNPMGAIPGMGGAKPQITPEQAMQELQRRRGR